MSKQVLDEAEEAGGQKKKGRGNLEALDRYWKGKMSDLQKGTFGQAKRVFSKKGTLAGTAKKGPRGGTHGSITNPNALAAWWHKRTTGMTPIQKYKLKGWKIHRSRRGKKSEGGAEKK